MPVLINKSSGLRRGSFAQNIKPIRDLDVLNFFRKIVSLGVTLTEREQIGINTLVSDLKVADLWSKIRVLYPFVGSSAISHSFNLKDVESYRITWSGSVTHNSNGITGMGGHGKTGISNNLQPNTNKSVSVYSRVEPAAPPYYSTIAGARVTVSRFLINYFGSDYSTLDQSQSAIASASPNRGLFLMTRNGTSGFTYFRNGSKTTKAGSVNTTNENFKWHLLAYNSDGDPNNNAGELSSENLALFHYGEHFTDNEETTFRLINTRFQTILGRNV